MRSRDLKQEVLMKSSRIDFVERGEICFPKISELVRRRKTNGALFENSARLSYERHNSLFARRALSAKWNSQNEWD